jgi:dGTPase
MVVQFSPAMWADLQDVRSFLFEHMYRAPNVVAKRAEVTQVVTELFPAFLQDPSLLPEEWAAEVAQADELGLARLVADYIAGMTDRFALQAHARLVGA